MGRHAVLDRQLDLFGEQTTRATGIAGRYAPAAPPLPAPPVTTPAPAPPLCGPCAQESLAWLDTRPSELIPRFGIAYGSGADYDVSPAGIRDSRTARWREWAETVRFRRRLIAQGCRAGKHSTRRRPAGELAGGSVASGA